MPHLNMGRFSIIIYITVALLLLLLVSRSPEKSSNHGRNHRRLKLRSNFTLKPDPSHHHREPVAFDPIVAELERQREDKLWEKQYFEHSHPEIPHSADSAPGEESQPEWEEFMDAEDYLNDEDKFNITSRLILLFPKIDLDPADGFVTENELTEWNLQQAQKEVMHRTQREMELHDKNRDGLVSFAEYDPPGWVHNSDSDTFGYDMGWWKEEHFNASDADGDGLLNITEFNDFLHPADSNNPNLLQWLCKEEVRKGAESVQPFSLSALTSASLGLSDVAGTASCKHRHPFVNSFVPHQRFWERDSDKDGKVNFREFFHGLFDLVRNYDEENENSSHSDDSAEAPAKILFSQLDKDRDGYLTDVELLPVMGKLHPSERYYAKQQADYVISQADSDKDGRLTLTEMIENPYVFYTAVFNDEEDEYDYHDEFR